MAKHIQRAKGARTDLERAPTQDSRKSNGTNAGLSSHPQLKQAIRVANVYPVA